MITFKQYLNEAPARESRLVNDVDRALNAAVRGATKLDHITNAQWWSIGRARVTTAISNNLRLAMNVLSPPLRNTAVVFHMDVRDTRPLTLPSALSKDQLPFDAVVIVEPMNGDIIAVPSLRQPLKSTFFNGRGAGFADLMRIKDVVKVATKNLTFYARNYKARRGQSIFGH